MTASTLAAMTSVFAADVALDWQHPAYRSWPQRQALSSKPRRVPAFPNGDHYAFVSPNLKQGTFGHPWEQTLCVFGADFVDAIASCLATWLPVARQH